MWKHLICIISVLYLFFDIIDTNSPKEYGNFKLSVLKLNLCKGPKRVDCCVAKATIENKTHFEYKIYIKNDMTPNRGKITAKMNNQPLLRLQMKKPCDHLYMKPLFQALLNVSQSCEFHKGNYSISIDIEEVAQKYYGGAFLYGNMTFRAVFYNDQCNFSCTELDVNFAPRSEH